MTDPAPAKVKSGRHAGNGGLMTGLAALILVLLYALVDYIQAKSDVVAVSVMLVSGIIAVWLLTCLTGNAMVPADHVQFDDAARRFVTDSAAYDGALNIIANRRQAAGGGGEYAARELGQRGTQPIPDAADVLFLEIDGIGPSRVGQLLDVRGVQVDGHRILRTETITAPNAIAAILLALRDATGIRPHCYFDWADGRLLLPVLRYLLVGSGYTAAATREIVRKVEPDPARRPSIHVGG
jgi:hypothetical protein